jgi:hypothetical protein
MARLLRIEYPAACYHVMNRGLSRSDRLLEDKDGGGAEGGSEGAED